jgi:outer membrane protein assembly complex protein YaeT
VKRVARIAGVVAGLVVLGVVALHLPSVRARVLDRARTYAERELHVAFRASNLSYGLFARSIELQDVSVASASGAEPFLQADRVVVVFGRGILRGRPDIASVSLSRPRVTLVKDRDGTLNLPSSQGSVGSSSPLHLGVVSVTALTVRFEDRTTSRSLSLGPLDLSLDTSGASPVFGTVSPAAFTARAGDTQLSGTLAGRLKFDGTRLTAENLTVETEEGRVAVDGWTDITGERPATSSRVAATVDLGRVARFARVDAGAFSGRLDATVEVSGPLTTPDVVLKMATREAAFARIGPFQLNGRASLRGDRAIIDALDLQAAAGALHVEGGIELGAATTHAPRASRLALRWSDLRIDDLVHAGGYGPSIRSGSVAAGSVSVEFDTRDLDSREWPRLRAAGTTTFTPDSAPQQRDSLALSGTADLTLDQGRWTLRHAIRTPRAGAGLTGSVTGVVTAGPTLRSTLGGRSQLRIADVGGLIPVLQAAHVTLPSQTVDGLGGSIVATLDLAGTIDAPRADLDVSARDLRSAVLPHAAAIDARLNVDADGVRLREANASSGTTSLRADGQYRWRGAYTGRLEVSQGDLAEIASQAHLPVTIVGSARMDANFTGERGTAEAVIALSARDLVVEQVAIGPLTANGRLALAAGALSTIEATAPDAGVRARVEIVNRAGYPISGEVSLEQRRIGALIPPGWLQQFGGVSGAVSATASGSGRLADPAGIRGRVDLRALDLTVQGTRVALQAPASLTLTADRLAADAVDLRIGQHTRATLDGELGITPREKPIRVRLEGPLSEWIEIGARSGGTPPAPMQTDGTATLDLTIAGTFDHPLPGGRFAIGASSLSYGALAPVTNLRLEAAFDPTVITVPAIAAEWRGATLGGNGTVPWRVLVSALPSSTLAPWLNALPAEPGRATLALRADNVTPAVLTDVLAADRLELIQGSATATLTADADRLSLDRIRATAVLDRASLVLAGAPVAQTVPTRLRLENGLASIESFRWSAGPESVVITGSANLAAAVPSVDAAVSGVVDLRIVSAFVPGISSTGTAKAGLQITGPADAPEIRGTIAVSDGALQLDTPRLAATDLEGTVQIAAGRQIAVSLDGLLNTGRAHLDGTIDLKDLAAPGGTLNFTGRGVALEFPSGLQTESNADLKLTLAGAASTLSGRVAVLGGTYREPLVLTRQLLTLASASGIARTAPPTDAVSHLRLDVNLETEEDVRIDNNYGRLDVGGSFRIVGTPASPGVLGRLQAEEDGEIYLGGNTYHIERLLVDLTSPRGIAPDVEFAAQTRVGDLPIGVELRCPSSGACERKITSLTNGVDDKEAEARLLGQAGTAAAAGENLARLLSGELLGVVGRSVGLDTVRLSQEAQHQDIFDDPTLVAGDVDPAARLTLGKRLGSGVEVVYSQNLADSGSTWITSYTGPRGLSARVLILDDNSRSYEFRHEPIGGDRARRRPAQRGPRVAAVTIEGTPGFTEKEVRGQLRLGTGKRFSFAAWQRDRDRLARFYQERGFLEARVSARQLAADHDGEVRLEYGITRGPATRTIVRGVALPQDVRNRLDERWTTALFDGFLEKDARTIVRDHLYREGYLNASVAASVALDASNEAKTLTIDVTPGPVVPSRIAIIGNTALSTDDLLQALKADGSVAAWLDPRSVERLLEDDYRSQGFLAARISVAAPVMVDGTSVVTISVAEGRPYTIGAVALNGVPDERRQAGADSLALAAGERYQPARVAAGVDHLEGSLRQAAYRQASASVDTRVVPEAARVDVTVDVTPGPRSILQDVVVEGDDAGKAIVARSITLAPGAPLDTEAINETRRRLYDLDAYRSVDIDVQPLAPLPTAASASATGDEPVAARITVEQRPRYRFRYGIAVSDEVVGPDQRDQQVGFAADFENQNLFGRGATAGASLRLRPDQQVGRLSLETKRLFTLPIRTTVFVQREREQQNQEGALPITTDISNLTLQQAYRVQPSIDLRWGYAVEKNHTFIRSDVSPFDLTVNIARFTTGAVVDRRNDAFNASRGWFTASTLELSTPGIGSDLKFLKDFTQYSQFFPLGRGLVVATDARLGLARTFDGEVLIPSERFYAGGASSVRGYLEDSLGAQSALGGADGGSALVVLNGELRFPVYRWLRGVGFVDAGNVFPAVRNISFTDLQVGIGAGARLDTPFGLIRFDFGVPANPRPFDPHWRFHFGFGHAF